MLSPLGDGPPPDLPSAPTTAAEPAKDAKGAAAKGPAKPAAAAAVTTLTMGNFSLVPSTGTVEPGGMTQVSVTFKAENARAYTELVAINVSDRDPADAPGGYPYEIAGESCIPGINAEDVYSIFEEQAVVNALDPFSVAGNVYAKRDRIFTFGAVIAQTLGAVVAAGPDEETGVKANFKFSNPNKVPCVVQFSIKPRQGGESAGKGGEVAFPMDVHPKKVDIPSNEHRYVTVYFNPTSIATYTATFEALVDNGADPKTKSFACELRGEGTLPHLTVNAPRELNPLGLPWLRFPRLLKGKKLSLPVALHNEGIVPASARLELKPHPSFSLTGPDGGPGFGSYDVEPRRSITYTLTFAPQDVAEFAEELQLSIRHNAFESQRIAVTGEGYEENVVFGGLPGDLDDELRFDDGPVGKAREAHFELLNQSNTHYRFVWPEVKGFKFSPSVGHLHARSAKNVQVTFTPEEPTAHTPLDIRIGLVEITYPGEPVDWDDRSGVSVKFVEETAADGTVVSKRTTELEPEPAHTAAAPPADAAPAAGGKKEAAKPPPPKKGGKGKEDAAPEVVVAQPNTLKVFAVADNARYECEAAQKPIVFRPTMMFQTRTYSFPLKNTSKAQMQFAWRVVLPSGQVEAAGAGPYSIKPDRGTIDANQTVDVTVRFSPTEVEDFERVLECGIPGLEAGFTPIAIPLNGQALRPWCHFQIPESNYVTGSRRSPELRGPGGRLGPLDPATKVVEFESLGTKLRNTKRFYVLNPTNVSYEFVWEPLPDASGEIPVGSAFNCANRRGVIVGGRRAEMVFEFTPEVDGLQESFWRFVIPEQNITVPFVLVGQVIEPRVSFDRSSINFGKVQAGARSRESVYLVNNELVPFNFAFDKATFEATDQRVAASGRPPVVDFSPSTGVVPPNSRLEITCTFQPELEKPVNYNVVCDVKKKPSRLHINIKGEGYVLQNSLQAENPGGKPLELSAEAPNALDFGQVLVNERSIKPLALINAGSVNFDFAWDCGPNPRVSVKPEAGSVPKGDRVMCELCYHPHSSEKLENYPVVCKIINGQKYTMLLSAVGHKPKLQFSFASHDFGPTFLYQQGMAAKTVMLKATNNDKQEISFDSMYESTPHLEVACGPTVLTPGQSRDIPVTFYPREAREYHETVRFHINGLYNVAVNIAGEGTPLRVDLVDNSQQTINFGSLRPNQEAKRDVRISNRSRIAATVSLRPSQAKLESLSVNCTPGTDLHIKPQETATITMLFKPPGRMRQFSEELVVEVAGVARPLLMLQGSCLGTDAKLSTDSLHFGTVVLGARITKRVQLENTGDVGIKFEWDTSKFGPSFVIFPTDGFLAPNQDVKFDITFQPTEISSDVRAEGLVCRVDGGGEHKLTLTGACAAPEKDHKVLPFQTPSRGTVTQKVAVENKTAENWHLKPTIQNNYWTGPEFLLVPAGKSTEYTLTYRPMAMSTKEAPHEGSLFFPLPDGTAIMYRLEGVADKPLPSGAVDRSVKAKAAHTEVVQVMNWLSKPQRFKAVIELEKGAPSTTLKGAEYIDVPALAERDYKLQFYAYKDGPTLAKVTFLNEATGEYLFYTLSFTAGAADVVSTVALECPVRQIVRSAVRIANPLATDVTLVPKCDDPLVTFKDKLEIKAGAEAKFDLAFRPLLVAASTAKLTLSCEELGVYEYGLQLAGTTAGPERTLTFNVPLGGREVQPMRFLHFVNAKTDYKIEFTGKGEAGFSADPSITAQPTGADGMEYEVEVAFEPTRIGDNFRDTLTLKSATGGDYGCSVVGRCIPPKPQGPVPLRGGKGDVAFKNVFTKEVEFTFLVDNPAFEVKKSEKVAAKKGIVIPVTFKDVPSADGKPGPRTGKLMVTCPESSAPWIFYLRAEEGGGAADAGGGGGGGGKKK